MHIYRFIHRETKAVAYYPGLTAQDAVKPLRCALYHRPREHSDDATKTHYKDLADAGLLCTPKHPFIRADWDIHQYEGQVTRYGFLAFIYHLDRNREFVINVPTLKEPPYRKLPR